MNIRDCVSHGLRFSSLILAEFQLFKLTACVPESMYWPSIYIALHRPGSLGVMIRSPEWIVAIISRFTPVRQTV
jgi:hypothetical protein